MAILVLGFSFHLPKKLNKHLSPLFCGLPLQQAARPALTPPWGSWGHGGPSKVSSTRHPGPAPEDSVFLLTLTMGRQDTRAAVALAHTRGTTEINMGRGWHRPGPVPSPSAAALLAQGMSAGYGDGGFPLELPETVMACDSAGRGAGSDLECLWWGAARGARARAGASTRPGPLAAAPPARHPLVGRSPPGRKHGRHGHRGGTGGHINLPLAWHEGFGKAQPPPGTSWSEQGRERLGGKGFPPLPGKSRKQDRDMSSRGVPRCPALTSVA